MTIYFVEIPHNAHPICWTTSNEFDAIVKISSAETGRQLYRLKDDATFDEAVEYLKSDLHALLVFKSTDEAAAALGDDSTVWPNHQFEAAHRALTRLVQNYARWITDPVVAVKYGAEVQAVLSWTEDVNEYTLFIGGVDITKFHLAEPMESTSGEAWDGDTREWLDQLLEKIEEQYDWLITNGARDLRSGTPLYSRDNAVSDFDVFAQRINL